MTIRAQPFTFGCDTLRFVELSSQPKDINRIPSHSSGWPSSHTHQTSVNQSDSCTRNLSKFQPNNSSIMSKKPDTPYPTSHAIEDMFNDSAKDHAAVVNALDDNVDGEVMGYEHHFAGKHKGKESIVNVLMADFSTMVNSDTVTYEVVNVIGGGDSPWAAVEGIATAKSKTGM